MKNSVDIMRIFDLHTHILPQIDDGASNMQQALEMLRNAVASDVMALALTPHSNVSGVWGNYQTKNIIDMYRQLCDLASDIPVKLFLGAEVRVTENLALLLKQKRPKFFTVCLSDRCQNKFSMTSLVGFSWRCRNEFGMTIWINIVM